MVVLPFPKSPLLFKPQAYNLPSLVKAKILVLLGETFTIDFPNNRFDILAEAPTLVCAVNSIGSSCSFPVPLTIYAAPAPDPVPHTCNFPELVRA